MGMLLAQFSVFDILRFISLLKTEHARGLPLLLIWAKLLVSRLVFQWRFCWFGFIDRIFFHFWNCMCSNRMFASLFLIWVFLPDHFTCRSTFSKSTFELNFFEQGGDESPTLT